MGWLDSLRGFFGAKEERASGVSVRQDPIIGELPLYLQVQRIGGQLTPTRVSELLQQADAGYMFGLADLANEARQKDCHLQSILQTRETACASLPWECVPAGQPRKNPKRRDQKTIIAEWVTDALNEADGSRTESEQLTGFRGMIAHLAGADYYGYSVAETLYERSGGDLVPTGWSLVAPRRIAFDQNTGRIHWWDMAAGMAYPGIDLLTGFASGKLLVHQPRITGDVATREGLCRVLMWAALWRNWDLRDWVALGELSWKPWRYGTYQKAADKKDQDALYEALRKMSGSGIAVLPETTALKVEWPGGAGSKGGTHSELFAVIGAEMSKAVLGQTLTTEQGSKGSQALGRVHDNVRKDILEFDATCLAETIRRDLIAPLVRMNFGKDAPVPVFRFLTEDAVDLKSFAEAVSALKKAGLAIPAQWVRDRGGIPAPEPDDEILGVGEEDIPIDPATGLPAEPAAEAPTEDEPPPPAEPEPDDEDEAA